MGTLFPIFKTLRTANLFSSYKPLLVAAKCNNNFLMPDCSVNYTKVTLEQRLGLPDRPKRPLTAYFRFMKEVRPAVIARNPGIKLVDAIKIIANMWETVDEEKKNKLIAEFKQDQAKYLVERAKYNSSLTDEQKTNLANIKEDLANTKIKNENRRRYRSLGRPKRPRTDFLFYMSAAKIQNPRKSDESHLQWLQRTSAKWNALLPIEKEEFQKLSQDANKEYQKELMEWEREMIEAGNIDVVRSSTLLPNSYPKKAYKKRAPKAE